MEVIAKYMEESKRFTSSGGWPSALSCRKNCAPLDPRNMDAKGFAAAATTFCTGFPPILATLRRGTCTRMMRTDGRAGGVSEGCIEVYVVGKTGKLSENTCHSRYPPDSA